MFRNLGATIVLLTAGLIATGCVTVARQYEGTALPTDQLANVRIGTTTRQEVLSIFGPPVMAEKRDIEGLVRGLAARYRGEELTVKIDPALFDEVFIYEYRRVNRLGLLFILYNYYGSVDKSDRLMFFFDAQGRVSAYGLTEGTREL